MAAEPPQRASRQRVLIAGGGAGGLEAMLALHALAGERVEVELLAPEETFAYRPLAVGEPFRFAEVLRMPLSELVEAHGARHRRDALVGVDAEHRLVHTHSGETLEYDFLVVAIGTRPLEAVPGALTFRGPEDVAAFTDLLERVESGELRRLVFAVPGGVGWPLPIYELAVLTGWRLRSKLIAGASLEVVTAEEHPLAMFGHAAGRAVEAMLEVEDVALRPSTHPVSLDDGVLGIVPGDSMPADAVVAGARPEGRHIPGLPADERGFVSIDRHARVPGVDRVFAVGDITAFPVKQGGIATQHADAAAEMIAAEVGAALEPRPFRPVLRGLLLVGEAPVYLSTDLSGAEGDRETVDWRPLWWPPDKIAGRYLGPALAGAAGDQTVFDPERATAGGVLSVEVELDDLGS